MYFQYLQWASAIVEYSKNTLAPLQPFATGQDTMHESQLCIVHATHSWFQLAATSHVIFFLAIFMMVAMNITNSLIKFL